jgi:hypothetical protein
MDWRDPYKLGILLQICLIIFLVSLLVYFLVPFFAVAGRLGLSKVHTMMLPAAVFVILIVFWRRVRGLVRKLREKND